MSFNVMMHVAIIWAMVAILTSCGTQQVWARSGGSIGTASFPRDWQAGDIESRIRKVVQTAAPKGLIIDHRRLVLLFESRKVSYAVTVRPDGSMAELKVRKTSGSEEIDKKGLAFIKAAAPFFKALGGITTDQTYFIEFPQITVTKDTDTPQE